MDVIRIMHYKWSAVTNSKLYSKTYFVYREVLPEGVLQLRCCCVNPSDRTQNILMNLHLRLHPDYYSNLPVRLTARLQLLLPHIHSLLFTIFLYLFLSHGVYTCLTPGSVEPRRASTSVAPHIIFARGTIHAWVRLALVLIDLAHFPTEPAHAVTPDVEIKTW